MNAINLDQTLQEITYRERAPEKKKKRANTMMSGTYLGLDRWKIAHHISKQHIEIHCGTQNWRKPVQLVEHRITVKETDQVIPRRG